MYTDIQYTLVVRKQRNTLRFATIRLKWKTGLKGRLKSTILYSHRPPWLKGILKFGTLSSHTPPWLKYILKSGISFIATDRRD
jgi:hypothetical protein